MSKWLIPAPVWVQNPLGEWLFIDTENRMLGGVWLDLVWQATAMGACPKLAPPTEAEARAWVEAEVMKALGATVAPDNA